VTGFAEDTIVRAGLEALAASRGVEPEWAVEIDKAIPVAAGLGGGSSDAAAALALANDLLPEPLAASELASLAARIGADVPFFLADGAQLGTGDGSTLVSVELPLDYHIVLLVPDDVVKTSTADVYEAFDAHGGATGFEERRAALVDALASVRGAIDLASLPRNDLACSPLSQQLVARGAFRADVSGAGPCIYGLFVDEEVARAAAEALRSVGTTFVSTVV
jgi:4-diphosphocytidyl-2-C-methyl-D-erythritol kinase